MKQLNREEYDQIMARCRDISIAKSNDYGCESLTRFMEKGVLIRMNDKMQRLNNLLWDGCDMSVDDEKVEDTALDMINYAAYLAMMLRNKLTTEVTTEEKRDAGI